MISGKRAFHGETSADTMSAILKEETPELSETARNVPPGLERICGTAWKSIPRNVSNRRGSRVRPGGVDRRFCRYQVWCAGCGTTSQREKLASSVGGSRGCDRARSSYAWSGLVVGARQGSPPLAEYKQITFRTGFIGNARYTPDGGIVYGASWDGGDFQLYLARTDDTVSRELGLKHAELLAISKSGELPSGSIPYSFQGMPASARWPAFRWAAVRRAKCWKTCRMPTGPPTATAWP